MTKREIFDIIILTCAEVCDVSIDEIINGNRKADVSTARALLVLWADAAGLTTESMVSLCECRNANSINAVRASLSQSTSSSVHTHADEPSRQSTFFEAYRRQRFAELPGTSHPVHLKSICAIMTINKQERQPFWLSLSFYSMAMSSDSCHSSFMFVRKVKVTLLALINAFALCNLTSLVLGLKYTLITAQPVCI